MDIVYLIIVIFYIPLCFQETIPFVTYVDPFNLYFPHNSSFFPSINEANRNLKLSNGTIIVFSSKEQNLEIDKTIIINCKLKILSYAEKNGVIKFLKNAQFFVEQHGEIDFRNFIFEIDRDDENQSAFSVSKDGTIFFHVKLKKLKKKKE